MLGNLVNRMMNQRVAQLKAEAKVNLMMLSLFKMNITRIKLNKQYK